MISASSDEKARAIAQCRANCLAVLVHYELEATVITAQSDRITVTVPKGFEARLSVARMKTEGFPFAFETWAFNRNHGVTAVAGWRERVALCSMQLIKHNTGVWEVDIDLVNPNFGIALSIGHLWEVLRNKLGKKQTDPFRIQAGLAKRGIFA